MNQKQLAILVALVVVIGGIGIVKYKGKKADWTPSSSDQSGRLLSDFPLNDVSEINIKTRSSEVNLTKGADGWKVKERGEYPAGFDNIHSLLSTVWEMEPKQQPKVGKSNLGRLKLVDPESAASDDEAATRVIFKAGGTARR